MKNVFLIVFALLLGFNTNAQQAQNMSLLSTWRDPDLSVFYNDIWGYAANGREYAILGSKKGTHFIDVTNPSVPVEVSFQPGANTNVIWRDFKTFGHYAYGVADNVGNTLQIFDLSNLPTSVTKVYDSGALSQSAHTCFIDNGKLYLVSNRTPTQIRTIDAFSLANPTNPTYIGTLNFPLPQMHAIHVRNDTAYCSAAYSGLFIFNIADITNPVLISSITSYPGQGYNHSSWTTADGNFLVFADEVPAGLPLKLYDISNKANPVFKSTFASGLLNNGSNATPHNQFIVGNRYVVSSYYHDGVQIWDILNPLAPQRIGYYDTYPNHTTYQGYEGNWGVYPFLPSGNIIASDITSGLFVLAPPYSRVSGVKEDWASDGFSVYPNPSEGTFEVTVPATVKPDDISVHNLLGQKAAFSLVPKANAYELTLNGAAKGMYLVSVRSEGKSYTKKVMVQ